MQVRRTLLVALAIVALFLFPVTGQDLASDRKALLALRSSLAGRTLLWDASQQSPCSWAGVQCQSGRVTSLRFPGASLSGQIPVGILGNLTGLKTLSLRLNALAGQIPPDLASCTGLRNLYLQGNRFSGPIPESLLGLRELVRLSLASNSLSGEISRSFSNLTRLRTLSLENNSLSGSIPAELSLPKLEQFNVSNNLLNGSIPDGLNKFSSAAFLGNSLCGKPLGLCPPDVPIPSIGPSAGTGGESSEGGKRKKLSGSAVAGIAIGCVFGFIFIVILAIFLCRKRGSKRTRSIDMAVVKQQEMVLKQQEMVLQGEKASGDADFGEFNGEYSVAAAAAAAMTVPTGRKEANGGGARKLVFFGKMARAFDLEDLLRASAEVLGKGTFGTSYKAVLEMGNMVAVKRLKDVNIAVGEFKEKIEAVGAMNHESLVPLRAFYYSNDEKLLVYDYMPMGSLSALLHGNRGAGRTPLNWELRSSIALGVARGIEYLHSQGHHVSHGNIKSSNVLLTKSHNARLSDFGLAHIVGPSVVPTRLAGYRAPEVTDPRRVSQKADVYSFGVLLLELLTGKAPANSVLNEEGIDLPRWVQSVVREEWSSEVFDLELLRYQNAEEEMVELLQLAMDCAAQYPDQRPSMPDVRRRIQELSRRSLPDHGPQPDQVDDVEVTSSH